MQLHINVLNGKKNPVQKPGSSR